MDGDTHEQNVRVRAPEPFSEMLLDEQPRHDVLGNVGRAVERWARWGIQKKPEVQFGDAVFDARFRVRTDDADRARAVFNAEVRSWLLADDRAARWPVVFRDCWLSSQEEKSLEVDDVAARLDYLIDLLERIRATAPRR